MKKIREGIEKWTQELKITSREKRLAILLAVGTVALTAWMLVLDNRPLSGSVLRNTYGEGDRQELLQVEVIAESDQEEVIAERIEIEASISEETYTQEELQDVFQACTGQLDTLIMGENESGDCICYDLNLVNEIPDTGVEVEWSWTPYEVLNIYGELQEAYIDEAGTMVELKAILSYGTYEMQYIKYLSVYPPVLSDAETIIAQIENALVQSDSESVTEASLVLPNEVAGYSLVWYGEKSYRSLGILLLGAAVLLYGIWDKKNVQHKEEVYRREQMLRDYPQIINTFTLYVGAGMTVKNAWKRMVLECDTERYAYAEMNWTYREMTTGISEMECYERFGKRCNIRCYQRLGLLLSQNVRKGTKGLTAILEREAMEAFDERKNRAKQEGEKAGTKLLMPMFLMLAVVLVIVIVPAFFSIQIT